MVTSTANRGKWAEGKVKAYLSKLNESSSLAWYRFPDAHAGSLQQSLSDFLVVAKGKTYLLEVKEVAHACRLPVANYKLQQRAKARSFELAGALALVLIYHSPVDRWRLLPNAYFGIQDKGSWDLTGQESRISCDLALRSFNI